MGERLTITSDESIKTLQLYNVKGELIHQVLNLNAKVANLEMSGLGSGLYIVMISNDVKYQTIKVVKK